jgi:HAD superfamily hydrolase (TIGR01509 family)
MIKTVIFDMDGVLIDSEPIHKSINQEFFREIGVPVSDKEYEEQFVGSPLEQMFVQLKQSNNISASISELTDECGKRILSGFEDAELSAAHGVGNLLNEIKNMGLNLAVGSSSSPKLISLVINKIGLNEYFQHLVSGYEVENGKPYPDLFLHIAGLFGTNPNDCFVIEDSALGVEASSRAGMNTIGVRNISEVVQNLSKADLVVEDFSSIEQNKILNAINTF